MNLDTIKYLVRNPARPIVALGSKGLLNWVPDNIYLFIISSLSLGYRVNLKNPRTYNEKLQWLKLYDRKSLYTQLVDKYTVREYIAEKIGEEYLIPLVGGPWNSVEEIDFDALPDQFALKTTHDSGGVVICNDKTNFDIEAAKTKLKKHMNRKYYYGKREWPYKNVKPRIIAEQYLENGDIGELKDYKFYCFGGEAKVVVVVTDRAKNDTPTKFTYFDMDFNKLPICQGGPNDDGVLPKPDAFDEMRELSAKLSSEMTQVRVDLYEVNGKVFFGELTFFDSSGMEKFDPPEWDEIFGSWIDLPKEKITG